MNLGQRMVVFAIRCYRAVISPMAHCVCGPFCGCRFTPSCSRYAVQAVERHGVIAGGRLALKRLLRCHPWGGCGADEVPETLRSTAQS